jgi:hypothetical protein
MRSADETPLEIIIASGLRSFDTSGIPVYAEFFAKPYDTTKLTVMLRRMALKRRCRILFIALRGCDSG